MEKTCEYVSTKGQNVNANHGRIASWVWGQFQAGSAAAQKHFLFTWINLNPAWKRNYLHCKVWDGITQYPSQNIQWFHRLSLEMDK